MPSPWPDVTTASDALGSEASSSAAGLVTVLDPSRSAGGLLLSSRGTADLFLFETGRPPTRIANVSRQGLARIAGIVKAKSGFFIGSYDDASKAFRVYRAEGSELSVVLETADIPAQSGSNAELVRSVAGDALGIWVRGTGWFVHPIDLGDGSVGEPFFVGPRELSTLPPTCADSAEGFWLVGQPPVQPAVDAPLGVSSQAIEGRFRASALGICVDELAAQGEVSSRLDPGATPAPPRGAGRATVPLTLSERKPGGRRFGFRCSN